ncbi:MAG: tetratricopeptide repeat protein [Candidatus Eremiobacterota bacterium]
MDEKFFHRLREKLERFDSDFKVETLKSCCQCYYCCTPVTKFPWLYPLEKDLIDKHISEDMPSSNDFQNYLLYTSQSVCPFYKTGSGCGIYTVRPLFCRMFGPVDTSVNVPHFCVYYDLPGRIPFSELKEFLYGYRVLHMDYIIYKLSENPDKETCFLLFLELGICYMLLYNFSEAFNVFSRALELHNTDYSVYYNLGWACLEMKRFEEAINYFTMAIKFGASEKSYNNIYEKLACIYIYEKMACVYLSLNMHDRAEEFYLMALKINKRNIICHTGLLAIYLMTGRKEEFTRKLKRLLARFPYDETVQKFASLEKNIL